MSGNYLFLNNEGSDKLMIVMTYEAMTGLQEMLDSIREQWAETDDFAYFALSGGMSQKGEMVDGKAEKD